MSKNIKHTIQYFNRYTSQLETEAVYGEKWLSWTYNTAPGQILLWAAVKRALFSKWYGFRMNRSKSKTKVVPFIQKYKSNVEEFLDHPVSYQTFNEFFFRKLKSNARPIDSNPQSIVFPADGRHFGFQNISEVQSIFAKGQYFDLKTLLGGSAALAKKYAQGSLVLSRLCPVDYHRFHFPVSGVAGTPNLINGPLYSVNPIALRKNIRYLLENKRVITPIQTPAIGQVLYIEIGATCVGSIRQTFQNNSKVEKGEEKGFFEFGGSSLITLFEPNTIRLSEDLVHYTHQGIELYAKMGDVMAMQQI